MKEQLKERLEGLKNEFEAGQKRLAELEAEQSSLRDTLLRISGAIQVLEEELHKVEQSMGVEETQTVEASQRFQKAGASVDR